MLIFMFETPNSCWYVPKYSLLSSKYSIDSTMSGKMSISFHGILMECGWWTQRGVIILLIRNSNLQVFVISIIFLGGIVVPLQILPFCCNGVPGRKRNYAIMLASPEMSSVGPA